MQPGYCVLCGGGDLDGRVSLVPKAWTHVECALQYSGDPWDIAELLPCCQGMTTLGTLGGSLLMKDERIPENQIWIPDQRRSRIVRFEIMPTGHLNILNNLQREEEESIDPVIPQPTSVPGRQTPDGTGGEHLELIHGGGEGEILSGIPPAKDN